MKPIFLLLLLTAACFAAPSSMDCNHGHQRHGHADDANKINPAQVVEAGLKKDDLKSVGDDAAKSDALQGVVGPEKKDEFKEVKSTEKDKKLPALTKDKVDKKSTAEVPAEGDKKKSDGEKFLDLNIKNVVPKETAETATKTKDDLQKATANAEESELADDATVAVAKEASDTLGAANKNLTAVRDALGKDSVPVDAAAVKTPDAAYAKKDVAAAEGGANFKRDLPIEALKDTKGIPEPPKASQNQMVITDTDAEQGDEAVTEAKKDSKLNVDKAKKSTEEALPDAKAKDTKDTTKMMMSDEAVTETKKDAKDSKLNIDKTKKNTEEALPDAKASIAKDTKDTTKMMMSDEALPKKDAKDITKTDEATKKDAKLDLEKSDKDSKVKKSDMAPAPAGIEAPKDSNVEALPAAKKDAKDTMKMVSDEAVMSAEVPKDASGDLEKTKKKGLREMEKKGLDPSSAAADKQSAEAVVKPKTRNVSTRMMKKGLAGRNTPGFMTGSMFISV